MLKEFKNVNVPYLILSLHFSEEMGARREGEVISQQNPALPILELNFHSVLESIIETWCF